MDERKKTALEAATAKYEVARKEWEEKNEKRMKEKEEKEKKKEEAEEKEGESVEKMDTSEGGEGSSEKKEEEKEEEPFPEPPTLEEFTVKDDNEMNVPELKLSERLSSLNG